MAMPNIQVTTASLDNIKLTPHNKNSMFHDINRALKNFENSKLKDKSQNLQETGKCNAYGKGRVTLFRRNDSRILHLRRLYAMKL